MGTLDEGGLSGVMASSWYEDGVPRDVVGAEVGSDTRAFSRVGVVTAAGGSRK